MPSTVAKVASCATISVAPGEPIDISVVTSAGLALVIVTADWRGGSLVPVDTDWRGVAEGNSDGFPLGRIVRPAGA